uniref:Uncharacterized protein n=1 Tax=Acrobeloides nanus TaxID=290746 RepID=A0A914DBN4_9BILA
MNSKLFLAVLLIITIPITVSYPWKRPHVHPCYTCQNDDDIKRIMEATRLMIRGLESKKDDTNLQLIHRKNRKNKKPGKEDWSPLIRFG